MKKPKLGQHFLKELKYVLRAVKAADIKPQDAIIEVGPGKGVLTKALLKKAAFLLSLEIDERLANRLHEKLHLSGNWELRLQDARQVDWSKLGNELRQKGYEQVKLIANLPYYLASQMIIHALAAEGGCDRLVVMVQDEVARRICAPAGSKEYSAFSIAVQYYGIPHYLEKVPPSAFTPSPRVFSALIKIDKRPCPAVVVADVDKFFFLVHAMFTHRRKTLRKCLQGLKEVPALAVWEQALAAANIASSRRPETLEMEEIARLFSNLYPDLQE